MKHLKTLIATCIALNIASSLAAQDLKRFKIEAFYGIEHVETNNKGTSLFVIRNRKQVGQNVSFSVNYGINDRLFLKTGLRVTSLTQTVVSNVVPDECGSSINSVEEEIKLWRTNLKEAQFIETALSSAFRYYVQKKKSVFNMYIESGADIIYFDEIIKPGLGIAYGFEVSLGQKAVVFIQPTLRLSVDNLPQGSNIDIRNSVGIAMGVRF